MEYFKVTSRVLVAILTLAVVFSGLAIFLNTAPAGTGDTATRVTQRETNEETTGFHGSMSMEGLPEQIVLGEKTMQFLGTQVKSADINGDGTVDIITNLQYYDTDLNAVVVFFGGGLTRYYTPSTADVSFVGPTTDVFAAYFTLGDFNGDEKVDIAIASFGTPSCVYIYLNRGSWSGTYNTSSADAVIYGAEWGEIGYLLQAGDINGDGKDDLVMLEDNYNGFQQIYVIYGRSTFASSYLINASEYDVRVNSTLPLLGGSTLWPMSDLDIADVTGDGFADLLIGCDVSYMDTSDGVVMLLPGGLYMPKDIDLKTYPHYEFRGYTGYHIYGVSHGDFNGDGQDDVMVWSPYAFHNYGGAFIFYTTSYNVAGSTTLLNADLIIRGPSAMGSLNFMGIEDLDGDGMSEIMVGSEDFNSGSGGLYIIYRNEFDNLLDNVYEMMFVTPGFSLAGPGSDSYLGENLKRNVIFTDFNNDGIMELTVGTPGVKNTVDEEEPQYAGGIYILHQIETVFEVRDFTISDQHEVGGVNVLGADYPYTMTFKVHNSWDRSDVHGMNIVFAFSGSMSGESISLSWTPATMEIRKSTDLGHYFELLSAESRALDEKTWYFNITFVLTHNITSEDPITIG
ncbi:MAG: VCBS repeat-containing protein, partial [Thermoplasmata archaeon]|nr:VCBS repeat-containing protein [Thermoplasmata archaeon]